MPRPYGARGNSWITIVIPEFIELLNLAESDPIRRFLLSTLERQVKALSELQHSDGLWHTLLDDNSTYLEASASAGFAYGILKAIRKRYLSKDYLPMAEKAIKAVCSNINEQGELQNTSFGTAMGNDLEYYKNIKITAMPYGQAMAILCLSEYLRRYI
ncbi:glycoside hydrolase family 88 protein [Marinomonas sp. RS-M-Aa-14]|uniref:glycoside hydrolase family 88 protein n=1 Tax=Marinomonas sp. RS-M-Aa-14 TaxID=3241169 RepID=UPI003AAD1FB2